MCISHSINRSCLFQEEAARGEIFLCLQYLPSAARLSLTVHKAENLMGRVEGLPSEFSRTNVNAKMLFLFRHIRPRHAHRTVRHRSQNRGCFKEAQERRTQVESIAGVERSPHIYNRSVSNRQVSVSFCVNFCWCSFYRCRLEVLVVDSDRFGNHRPIGRVQFPTTISNTTTAATTTTTTTSATTNAGQKTDQRSSPSRLWKDAIQGLPMLPQWIALESVAKASSESRNISTPLGT